MTLLALVVAVVSAECPAPTEAIQAARAELQRALEVRDNDRPVDMSREAKQAWAARSVGNFQAVADAERKLDQLEHAQGDCQRREARELAQAEKEAQARARAEAEKAEALQEEKAQEALAKPKVQQALASVNLCDAMELERAELQAIREEKANSRIAGVENLSRLMEMQDQVVQYRRFQKTYRERLKAVKLPALPCTSPGIVAINFCRENTQDEDCDKSGGAMLARLAWRLDLRNQ